MEELAGKIGGLGREVVMVCHLVMMNKETILRDND